jgi:DNA-binding LacI/PurR family transcriptional regulator
MAKQLIDKNDPIPRYLQVRRCLEEAILAGRYRPGAQLPGERELAQEMQVSQMTVNKALQAMTRAGWLRREVGKGTFVRENFRPPVPAILRLGFAVPTTVEDAQEDFYLGPLLRGIQRAITNAPVNLTIIETSTDAFLERLMEAPIDGCLLTDVLDRRYADVQQFVEAGRKVVLLGVGREPLPVPYVDSDNYGGARAALEHLLSLGHRRVAGAFAYMNRCNTRDRLRGYQDVLREQDITVPSEYVITFGDAYTQLEPLHTLTAQLLARDPRPTAFFCGGYYIALEVIQAVQEAGLRIPEDISVVGFDDPRSASYLAPPLTTVYQPLEEMGKRATLKLLQWLRTHQEPSCEVLPAALRVRGSTAPAPRDVL